MKLYAIQIRHCSPKDCKESIVGYVITENDTAIFDYIDKQLMFGTWSEWQEDSLTDPLIIYDDDCNVIGDEFFKEKMLRLRGEFNNPDADYSDAYYGITHYGWSEGKEISDEESNMLIRLGIATKI
jgi:hypothetical protein